jgi:tRNA-dihydrouridine synthase B
MIHVGHHEIRNPYALAPMAGLADVPLRTLAWGFGAGYMVSEMVSSKPELWETGKSSLRRVPVPGAFPVAVQIAGTDPQVMADAARRHVDEGVQVIDINFGCPAKKVCRRAAGSALLADLALLGRIVETVARAVAVPVTVKTRTGLVPGDDQGVAAGEIAAAAGAAAIVMHARSRACRFSGPLSYGPVARLKQRVSVPVLVNGNINDAADARSAMLATGADGVMVGRGVMGQPWLFAELTGAALISYAQRWATMHRHVASMHDFYGESVGVRMARKHIAAYLARLGVADAAGYQRIESGPAQLEWISAVAEAAMAHEAQACVAA